jgi:hypothetical protein
MCLSWICFCLSCVNTGRIAELWGRCMFSLIRKCQNVFQRYHKSSHSSQQFTCSAYLMIFEVVSLLIVTLLLGVYWYFFVALIYFSLMINDVCHFSYTYWCFFFSLWHAHWNLLSTFIFLSCWVVKGPGDIYLILWFALHLMSDVSMSLWVRFWSGCTTVSQSSFLLSSSLSVRFASLGSPNSLSFFYKTCLTHTSVIGSRFFFKCVCRIDKQLLQS